MKINGKEMGTVFLAPMAGVTDLAFRLLCREFGADMTYTEMISAKAMSFGDKKTKSLLYSQGEAAPKGVQLFGSEPQLLAGAAISLGEEFDVIDLNMGCPAPKITKNGEGSALMKKPKLASEIVSAASRTARVPVSVKIRRGWDAENCAEIAKAAEDAGAAAITVHGRLAVQMYSGRSELEAIYRVKKAVSIPVIGNGDIFSAQDAHKMLAETGCDAVMVGRGAMGNPFIFREIKHYLATGEELPPPSVRERVETAIKHISVIVALKGERIGIQEARKHAAWYVKGIKGAAAVKREVFKAEKPEQMYKILGQILS